MNQKHIQDKLNKLFDKALKMDRKCSHPNCNNNAINSHILQKNGLLSGIATNNHVYVSKTDFLNPDLFKFKRSGINVTYTFKGFCSLHDKQIFQPIEDFEIDFEDYKSQLLFVYRTILNEKRKKEVLIDWDKLKINDSSIQNIINPAEIKDSFDEYTQAIKDIEYFENLVLSDLNGAEESFVFKVKYVREIDICLASFFTLESTRQLQEEFAKTGKERELLTDIFISFFPIQGESVVIIGYLKSMAGNCEKFINDLFAHDEDLFLKQMSNILLRRCEEWVCSETFYKDRIQQRESKINEIFREAAESIDEDKDIEFNLFE